MSPNALSQPGAGTAQNTPVVGDSESDVPMDVTPRSVVVAHGDTSPLLLIAETALDDVARRVVINVGKQANTLTAVDCD